MEPLIENYMIQIPSYQPLFLLAHIFWPGHFQYPLFKVKNFEVIQLRRGPSSNNVYLNMFDSSLVTPVMAVSGRIGLLSPWVVLVYHEQVREASVTQLRPAGLREEPAPSFAFGRYAMRHWPLLMHLRSITENCYHAMPEEGEVIMLDVVLPDVPETTKISMVKPHWTSARERQEDHDGTYAPRVSRDHMLPEFLETTESMYASPSTPPC
ncbi:hypothetical protein MLD38_001098 [Melastoma candidum]|uniref:Uncharacterized protein n=1 Tax=Melastoma candidum TaxID=119954 RepID=A0ACB9SBG1_9MYRT|nr:hypothetical protein MLD38_001098 [Melastoma candidum]